MRLFSQLVEFLLCSFVTRKNPKLRVSERVKACLHTKRTKQFRAAKRRHRDSRFKQSFAFRSLCFRRCCHYAANSGTGQLAVHVSHTTLLSPALKHSLCATSAALGIMQINLLSALVCTSFLRSFSSFAANNNSRSYSAVF